MEQLAPPPAAFPATFIVLALALPLLSGVVSFLIADRYSWLVSVTAPFIMLVATVAAAIVFVDVWQHGQVAMQADWFVLAGSPFRAGIWLNTSGALMLLIVTIVSFLVHLYSIGYMAGDADIRRYFAMLGFFTFAMLGVVAADNLLLVFVCWELVGFASYMLIGHWQQRPQAASAAKRAFIINRVGDAGFVVGLMIVWAQTGTFDIAHTAHLHNMPWQTAAALAIFCGVIGKSAQFPLFAWLPDAMEGPTPVSALIHAATMVAAGVFVMARLFVLFTPTALDVVMITGCVTALLGAVAACAQHDLKKILAYSTISQLGLMVVALGAGAPAAALFHLFTHAFFKACLFLGAGAVIHALHQAQHQSHVHFDVQDLRNLGGLRKKMPFTFVVFVISGGALAGVPFTTGFLSKDAIFVALQAWAGNGDVWRWLAVVAVAAVSFLTVLYTFRMAYTIFGGSERTTAHLDVKEVPAVMRAPMAVLAAASVWMVFALNPFNFSGWVYSTLDHAPHTGAVVPLLSSGWVLLALAVAYTLKTRALRSRFPTEGFYLNRVYDRLVAIPAVRLASVTGRVDKKWIDGALHAAAYVQLIVAHLTGWFDRAIVDGAVDGVAYVAKSIGSFTRSFQGGKIQLYIFWALFTIIIFIIWTLL